MSQNGEESEKQSFLDAVSGFFGRLFVALLAGLFALAALIGLVFWLVSVANQDAIDTLSVKVANRIIAETGPPHVVTMVVFDDNQMLDRMRGVLGRQRVQFEVSESVDQMPPDQLGMTLFVNTDERLTGLFVRTRCRQTGAAISSNVRGYPKIRFWRCHGNTDG